MYKVASLFSGVGGFDFGFHELSNDFKLVFANDFQHYACETYRANFKDADSYLKEGDITEFIENIPEHDILLGGFPCQAFSLAGNRKGFEDERGLQYLNCVKSLQLYKPKVFYFENVKGILSHDNGKTIEKVVTDLEDCGYNLSVNLVKMEEYGISQRRHRVIFIGVREDLPYEPTAFLPEKRNGAKPVNELLKDIPSLDLDNDTSELINHNFHFGTVKKMKWILMLKDGENLKDLSEDEIRKREVEMGVESGPIPKTMLGYRRLKSNEIAPTMMFGNTCLPIHFEENRSISVREAAFIQSFPLTFEFKGGISYQYKQVGNAVPPMFSKLLAERFLEVMKKYEK